MGHLPSLELVQVGLWTNGASIEEVQEVNAALRLAVDAHLAISIGLPF
jgi:hypothetical protein